MASLVTLSSEEEDLRDCSTKKVKIDEPLDAVMEVSKKDDSSPSSSPKLKVSHKDMVAASEMIDFNSDVIVKAVTDDLFPDLLDSDDNEDDPVEFNPNLEVSISQEEYGDW
ncbi:zn-finger domain-containing protein, partial [Sesbania bispinosa]